MGDCKRIPCNNLYKHVYNSFILVKCVELKWLVLWQSVAMAGKKPLILVTNDDGIDAGGIHALVEVASQFGEVLIVAPDSPQSGMGHAISVHTPLRLKEYFEHTGHRAYSCSGTPVDCVKLAIYHVLKGRPDLVVSGVNHGSNCSINVLYSGTMSAAVEGAIEGIPSIGLSLLNHDANADFTASKVVAEKVIGQALEHGIPTGTCLNVNIPDIPLKDLKGIRVCRQGQAHWEDEFDTRVDPFGGEYHWLTGQFNAYDKGEDTDMWALNHNYVSLVPTQFDMTAHHVIGNLSNWDFE